METTETEIITGSQNSPNPLQKGKRANWTIAHEVKGTKILFTVKGAGVLELETTVLATQVIQRAALHGLVQRISDAAAMARDTKTGASASPEEKFQAMKRLVEHYSSGAEEWSPARSEGGEREVSGAQDLRTALGELYPDKTPERVKEYVKSLKAAERAALAGSEKVKVIIDRLREERAMVQRAGVDVAEVLKGLEG